MDDFPLSLACVNINQREPKVEMVVETNGPALIGEWFKIKVNLKNNEDSEVKKVSVVASLEEANDPIIADTTKLTLDYKYESFVHAFYSFCLTCNSYYV